MQRRQLSRITRSISTLVHHLQFGLLKEIVVVVFINVGSVRTAWSHAIVERLCGSDRVENRVKWTFTIAYRLTSWFSRSKRSRILAVRTRSILSSWVSWARQWRSDSLDSRQRSRWRSNIETMELQRRQCWRRAARPLTVSMVWRASVIGVHRWI